MNPIAIAPQSGLEDSYFMSNIGNTKVDSQPDLFSALCVGDKVSNFRALLRRYTYYIQQPNALLAGYTLFGTESAIIQDYIPIRDSSGVGNIYADMFTIVGSCYALRRGGIRIRVNYDRGNFTYNGETLRQVTAYLKPNTVVNGPFGNPSVQNMFMANVEQNFDHGNTLSVEIPQYTKTYATATLDAMGAADPSYPAYHTYTVGSDSTVARVALGLNKPTGMTHLSQTDPTPLRRYGIVSRAMADDGEFMTFISVPVMLSATSTVRIGYQGASL
jgi:hypothetical protein